MNADALKIFLVVNLYWFVSISTVFVNKYLLSSENVNLEAPFFITWFQCVVSAFICFVASLCSRYPALIVFSSGRPFSVNVVQKIMPLSLQFITMVTMNNLCLKYVGVSFYYIGRSLTTIFNVILTYFLLKQSTSLACILCCCGIAFGFVLGVDQESLTEVFSWNGIIFGVCGSLALAMYSIQTKKALQFVNQEVWLLSYYNNIYSSLLFLPLIILSGELNVIFNYEKLFTIKFLILMMVGGMCGFTIGVATALQIKITSALTHNISGTAKACVQTILATYWYSESKSFLWWFSNFLVLFSTTAYSRIRQQEMSQHNLSYSTIQKT